MKTSFLSKTLGLLGMIVFIGCSNDDNRPPVIAAPSDGAVLQPTVGGSTQPNHVFVNLRTEQTFPINRESWDLGFYCGNDFRVVINGSIQMAVKAMNTTDITLPQQIDEAVAVGTFDPANVAFIDHPTGDMNQTAIQQISTTLNENQVYLVNLGTQIPNAPATTGAINITGENRGWRKIRVLRNGQNYVLQHAAIASSQFTEVTIEKNTQYNFVFYSLVNNQKVVVEPKKDEWDLNFTAFTNTLPGFGSYLFSDGVLTNVRNGVVAYQVLNSTGFSYDTFTISDVDNALFSNDQRTIGANWRSGGGPTSLPSVRDDRFYVVKDTQGNVYKVQFISMTNAQGERGFPTFQYALLAQ
jgi:hypothetical protein